MAPPTIDARFTPSLHPHLIISTTPLPGCALHLSLSIPDALFPDPDELADIWGPASLPSSSSGPSSSPLPTPLHWYLTPSVIDIERPLRPESQGSALSVLLPHDHGAVDIPLHARYLSPTAAGGWNVTVFGDGGGRLLAAWECGDSKASLVDTHTTLALHLPAAKPQYALPVELATHTVVWLAWAWVMYRLVGVVCQTRAKVKME